MMMIDALLATILIVLTVAAWRFMPRRPIWLAPVSPIILFALLTAVLIKTAGSPFAPDFGPSSPGVTLWHQIIMAGWWIIAAKSLLAAADLVMSFGRHSRETKLASELIAAAVYLGAVLHVINTVFAVPIGGLVATSGVIAIVLGLALQNTLADVFAGIAVGIEGPISVGDRVWMDGGVEGEVVEINWRSVRIRTDGNDIAIVPHSVVAKSRLINRSYPTTRRGDAVTISVEPTVSPGHVTDLIKRAVLLCSAILRDPAPSVALVRLGRKSNKYEVAFSVSSSDLLWGARSALLKEIARQFRYAGIKPTWRYRPDDGRATDDLSSSADLHDEIGMPEEHSTERLIDELPLFHGLSKSCRQQLASHLVRHVIESQHIVFAQGATEASLFIVASGVLEVTRETPERKHILGRIGPGDYIGEIGMLTGAPHAATVTALTPCIVYELRKEHVAAMLASQPELVSAFEASARRGQELIARAVAAGVNPHDSSPGQLLSRIRAFFNLPS
ncbi:MAG TPA: mechanosensitive ion channel family protein [Dongiaceae bacterium]|nr:mechanosensitive ion channel family protein [Dongiaceae bacterium]